MFVLLLKQQWKEFWRGRNKTGSIVARVIFMLLVLYLILVTAAAGFFMTELIRQARPGADPVHVFNGLIIYYFLIDFLIRIQMQELPTLSIQPYLTLNIRRKNIVRFLNTKTLYSVFNFLPLLVFLPFCFRTIGRLSGLPALSAYVVSIVSLMIVNNFLVLYLKRKGNSNGWFIATGVIVILLAVALDYQKIFSLRAVSDRVFVFLSAHPYVAILFVLAAAASYVNNSSYLYRNLYIEELSPQKRTKTFTHYPFLDRFGKTGTLMILELKLIFRHKRSRSALIRGLIFIFYGLFIYRRELLDEQRFGTMIFAAVFMTGFFQIIYGQFMFAWQSSHFDGLMTHPVSFSHFIGAKFMLFKIITTVITAITLLYGFISWKLVLLHLSIYLYDIGFGSVIVLFFACYNRKRLDLTKGASFNWQGTGITQWIQGLPFIFIPFLIYLPFGVTNHPLQGLLAIAVFGLITLSMQKLWVRWITRLFVHQRYKISEGFRE